ncbi:MAG TPA: GNAT family N-acetyltransferase [Anaerolineales bacterium]|nr:GNAT family N-acetyltransferase [Anaerolineales bacterium]HQX17854.1 GNAT family N-acetyltransferase [Anaerolineales bacterium]
MIDIRPAVATDIPRLMALDHKSRSDYVWQLDLKRETNQAVASFREVRLPRTVDVIYPRNQYALADEWTRRDLTLVAIDKGAIIGYLCAKEEHASSLVWVTDLVVTSEVRRAGAASALLLAAQAWASERGARRLILEMQSKNEGGIRLAQKFGYEFCGYNDHYYPTQDVTLFFGRTIK